MRPVITLMSLCLKLCKRPVGAMLIRYELARHTT